MADVKLDVTAATSKVQEFKSNNDDLKQQYGTLKPKVSVGLGDFNTPYFDEMEKFVGTLHTKIDRIQLGANQYFDALNKFNSSIVYTPGSIPDFPTLGNANPEGGITNSQGGGQGDSGQDVQEENPDVDDADKGDKGDSGKDVQEENPDVDDADKGDKGDSGKDVKEEDPDVDDADKGDKGDSGKDVQEENPDVDDAESGGKGNSGTDVDVNGDGVGGAGSRVAQDALNDFDLTDPDVAEAITEEEAEDLLARLLAEADPEVEKAQGHSAAAGLSEAIHGTGENVQKSGVGLGALAAILGTIAAGGGGLAAFAGSKKGENSLGDIAGGNAKLNGTQGGAAFQAMLGGIASGTTGYTLSELMSGKFPEPMQTAMNAINTVMNVVDEAGIISNQEMEFAMSGQPYAFAGLSEAQKQAMYFELANMVDKYGGVEGFLESTAARNYIENLGSAYDALNTIMGKTPEEVRNAMRGLLDPNNPNIGGVPISKEARDFIINFLQEVTGLPIQQLLDGTHDKELYDACEALMDVLKVFKMMAELTPEELRQFLYDLLDGKFPELAGLTPFTVKTFKEYLGMYARRNGCPVQEFYNIPGRCEALRVGIREYSGIKYFYKALSTSALDVQDVCSKIFRGEGVNIKGRMMDPLSQMVLKSMLNVLARYNKCSVDLLLTDAKYKVVLAKNIEDLYKYSTFQGMFCTLKPDMLFARVNAMSTGKNFGLNGFTFVDIESLKKACETYAFNGNIKINDLLTNRAHAGTFKQFLINNDTFIKLMLLFENLSDNDVQVLINNLMKAWDEEFKARLQNLLNYANKKRVDNLIKSADKDLISNMRVVSEDSLKAGLEKITSKEGDLYKRLLEIYTSNKKDPELAPELVYLVKFFLLLISINQKLAVKDMINNDDSKVLIHELLPYVKLYPGKLTNRSDLFNLRGASEFIGSILGGYYPDILGYEGDKYKLITDLYYKYASNKGTNPKELLTDVRYAVEVATFAAKDATNRIIAIFVREIPEIPTQRFLYSFILNSKK